MGDCSSVRECIYQHPACRDWVSMTEAATEIGLAPEDLRSLCESDPELIKFQYAGECECGRKKILISRRALVEYCLVADPQYAATAQAPAKTKRRKTAK